MSNNIINEDFKEEKDELVYVCTERLKKLELLEKSLPELIERAISDHKKEKLKLLHEKDKLNPAAVNARVKRYNERHKEEIAARKNAKRNQEKNQHSNSVIDSFSPKQKSPEENKQKIVVANMVTNKDFTIRFDL